MSEIFSCNICDFSTYNKSNYNKHLVTVKHIENRLSLQNNKIYCNYCSKSFLYKKNLDNHISKCKKLPPHPKAKIIKEDPIEPAIEASPIVKEEKINIELITEIVKTVMTESFKFVSEKSVDISHGQQQNNNHNATTSRSYNNTHSHNRDSHDTFNLNLFLNEKCKDAMNLSDFVEQIKISNSDLDNIGKNGFVNGLTDIIYTCLENCGIYKRPMHCTDIKRETMHVKEDGVWKKEDQGNPNIKKSIEKISDKCFFGMSDWMKEHPDCKKLDSNDYDTWIKIGKNVSSTDEKNFNKIKKNIAETTVLEKEK